MRKQRRQRETFRNQFGLKFRAVQRATRVALIPSFFIAYVWSRTSGRAWRSVLSSMKQTNQMWTSWAIQLLLYQSGLWLDLSWRANPKDVRGRSCEQPSHGSFNKNKSRKNSPFSLHVTGAVNPQEIGAKCAHKKCPRQSVHIVKTTTISRYAAHALATSNRNVIASWFESAFAQRRSHPAGELAISTVFLPQLSRSLSAPPSRNKNKICTSADYIVLVSCTRG